MTNNDKNADKDTLAIGCFGAVVSFLIVSVFNDLFIGVSPVFFVILGGGMAVSSPLEKAEPAQKV